MIRLGLVLLIGLIISCGNKEESAPQDPLNSKQFAASFTSGDLPYNLIDTGLLNGKDTTTLPTTSFSSFISDSLRTSLFGSKSKVSFHPLFRTAKEDGEQYFVIKAKADKKVAALLIVFDKAGQYQATFPFLVPDKDNATTQVSTLDKSYLINQSITKRLNEDETGEGKDVFAYDETTKSFILIMTDVLDDAQVELINPIDTLPQTHPLSGDYRQGKRSLVSIRNGRNEKEVQFFIHIEKEEDCTGELKGTALFTSSKVAVYRQGGDPCVMELHFSGSSVSLKEMEGCGAHRSLKCSFDGGFTRKKVTTAKDKSTNNTDDAKK